LSTESYSREAATTKRLASPVDDLGAQSTTAFDPDYDIDGDVPHEKPVFPASK